MSQTTDATTTDEEAPPEEAADNPIEGTVDKDLSEFQYCALRVIEHLADADGPTYGLAIKGTLESVLGTEINHGRLYPNLDELVEKGLITKGSHDKRTNEYQLTRRGARTLDQFRLFMQS